MSEELRAIDLADAQRDSNRFLCEACHQRDGTDFFCGNWLCDGCREEALHDPR
jgi:hypothetical protein